MKYLIAKSDKELGICLRILMEFTDTVKVITIKNNGKVEFHIEVDDSKYDFERLSRRFDTYIS